MIINVYEFIQMKLKEVEDKIAELLLEGDAHFKEWEAINKLMNECYNFLNFLKSYKERDRERGI